MPSARWTLRRILRNRVPPSDAVEEAEGVADVAFAAGVGPYYYGKGANFQVSSAKFLKLTSRSEVIISHSSVRIEGAPSSLAQIQQQLVIAGLQADAAAVLDDGVEVLASLQHADVGEGVGV